MVIGSHVGSEGAERVLLFLAARGDGYSGEIASFYGMDVSTVQNPLTRMERDGLLVNRLSGRTRVYGFYPRYAFLADVKALLTKAFGMAPGNLRDSLTVLGRRPRRTGRPL